jgi:putative transposase
MTVNKAYKFRVKLGSRQEHQLSQYAGSCRFIWNKLLGMQKDRMQWGEWTLNDDQMCEVITAWKAYRYPWLTKPPSQALQQTARDLHKAMENAFDPKRPQAFPAFKKQGRSTDSFRVPQGFKWDKENTRIFIPKLGWLQYFSHSDRQKLMGEPGQVTISRQGPHWNVSIQVEFEVEPEPVHPNRTAIGIDMGIVNFACLSDGTVLEPLNSFRRQEKRLATEQRNLSRKCKFSSNWRKQATRVSGIHRTIGRCRHDYTNKASTTISHNHAYLVMEDLKIVNMAASAAGTAEEPGRNVAAKSGLNKAILDQGWGDFRRKATYKEKWRGGHVILVPPHGTSQECPECGHRDPGNRKSRDIFCCLSCGYTAPADLVGSIIILRRGTPYLPVEGEVMNPMKQEPNRHEADTLCLGAGILGL